MSWFLAGSAALTVGTSYISGMSAQKSGILNANAASKAEGEAIVKERLNTTIRNSYSTAMAQMQLGLQKRQLSQQGADISAAGQSAMGAAVLGIESTGSIGASTAAVVSDIDQKVGAAQAQNAAQFENMVENYNNDLSLMVLNTDQSAPTVRQNTYNGPSSGEVLGMSLLSGVASFASNYGIKQMQLGLGAKAPVNIANPAGGLSLGGGLGLKYNAAPSWGYTLGG